MAMARQPRFTAFSDAPTNAAYAPRRTFSAAYQGSGRPRIFLRQSRRMAPSRLKNSGPCARPRTKLSTSSAAQRAEKLLSVAPSATATRQRVGESEPRIAHASSYSDWAFPAFWQENASMRTAPHRPGAGRRSPEVRGTRSDVEELDDLHRLRVEDEAARSVACRHAQLLGAPDHEGRQAAGHLEELLGELVRQPLVGGWAARWGSRPPRRDGC